MPTKIVNMTPQDLGEVESNLQDMYESLKSRLGFQEDAEIYLVDDQENADDIFGKTGFYSPDDAIVVIYTTGRHPKDILRSTAHELVHHAQACRGEFEEIQATDPGYAQSDPHLREMEREAYEQGNLLFRDWEDKKKSGVEQLHENWNRFVNEGPNYDASGLAIRVRLIGNGRAISITLIDRKKFESALVKIQKMHDTPGADPDMASDILIENGAIVGDIYISQSCKDTFRVNSAAADRGYGPYLYELAMSAIYPRFGLTPDRGSVSAEAEKVWTKFDSRFDDSDVDYEIAYSKAIGQEYNGQVLDSSNVKRVVDGILKLYTSKLSSTEKLSKFMDSDPEAYDILDSVLVINNIDWENGEKFPPETDPFLGKWDDPYQGLTPFDEDDCSAHHYKEPGRSDSIDKAYKYGERKEELGRMATATEKYLDLLQKKASFDIRNYLFDAQMKYFESRY